MLRTFALTGLVAAAFSATFALAEDTITVTDPYARASTRMSVSGAAFMVIENHGTRADRLIAAKSDVSDRVELHTHIESANGVMQMVEVEAGFSIPAGGSHALKRGGDHVMFLGLSAPMEDGTSFPLTLVFENAGEITVDVPVDLTRKPAHGTMMHGHGHAGHAMPKASN